MDDTWACDGFVAMDETPLFCGGLNDETGMLGVLGYRDAGGTKAGWACDEFVAMDETPLFCGGLNDEGGMLGVLGYRDAAGTKAGWPSMLG
jgi:hypothetical protein